MRKGSYVFLTDGEWADRIARFDAMARSCTLCPRNCHIDRTADERGFCAAPAGLVVSSAFAHHGEEPPICGSGGSGTIFFSHCTLKCCFCQNWQISHRGEGEPISAEKLARMMTRLQDEGCHNINLVTATHFLPWLLRALRIATKEGLTLPLVYNCGGYEHASTIRLLDGIVDIYLPDMKYGDDQSAQLYSRTANYCSFSRSSLREMFRQVGPLRIDEDGIASRGVCVRHLVLPNDLAASALVVDFLLSVFDPEDIHVSLMAQYRPLFHANRYAELSRTITRREYEQAKALFVNAGFAGFYQKLEIMDEAFIIDFTRRKSEPLLPSSPSEGTKQPLPGSPITPASPNA